MEQIHIQKTFYCQVFLNVRENCLVPVLKNPFFRQKNLVFRNHRGKWYKRTDYAFSMRIPSPIGQAGGKPPFKRIIVSCNQMPRGDGFGDKNHLPTIGRKLPG